MAPSIRSRATTPLLAFLSLAHPTSAWLSQSADWLVSTSTPTPTTLKASPDGSTITLSNGIISRSFVVSPCFTTVEYSRVDTRFTFFRQLSPEATLTLNGVPAAAGVCTNLDPRAIPEFWTPENAQLHADPLSLTFVNYSTAKPVALFPWTPGSWHTPNTIPWPPKGLTLTATFTPPAIAVSNSSSNFTTLGGYEFPCPPSGCLTGWPTCNNNSVSGQCSWPAAVAVSECAAWPACMGVTCNHGRTDCQARAAPFVLQATPGFSSSFRSQPHPAAGALVNVHYEMYDGIPALRKWLTVTVGTGKGAAKSVLVDTVLNEILRAPNFAPDQMTVLQVQANNPTPATQQVVPQLDQSFPGRTQQYWYFDPEWDACCDGELHVPYTYYTLLQVGYGFDVTFGGPTGPGALVTPSNPWVGQSSRFVLHDTTDWERQGNGIRKVQSVIAPQLLETPLAFMITDISTTEAFRLAITQASAVGIELIIIGFGANGWCGMCPGQIQNATFVAWFKEQVDFAHSLNVDVGGYTLMQHNGWGETVPEAEQVLNRDGTRGPTACFSTGWHLAYRQSVLEFASAVGLSSVETDGQFEGAACADNSGDHNHNGLVGSWDAQMWATANFNADLKAENLYQTGADAYWMSGANRWNHADTDAGYSLPNFFDRINVGRDYVFDSTTTRLGSSGGYGIGYVADDAKVCDPYPGRWACLNFALASFYGQGVVPTMMSATLWDPTDPDASTVEATFKNWTTFFSAHRPILTSPAVTHLVRPTTRSYEAISFFSPLPTAPERGFVAVYNPSNTTVSDTLSVPLYLAGIRPGTVVTINHVVPGPAAPTFVRKATVGDDGGAIFDVSVPVSLSAYSYAFYSISA
jgi:hypothetical protein